jgi:hypothetical protein
MTWLSPNRYGRWPATFDHSGQGVSGLKALVTRVLDMWVVDARSSWRDRGTHPRRVGRRHRRGGGGERLTSSVRPSPPGVGRPEAGLECYRSFCPPPSGRRTSRFIRHFRPTCLPEHRGAADVRTNRVRSVIGSASSRSMALAVTSARRAPASRPPSTVSGGAEQDSCGRPSPSPSGRSRPEASSGCRLSRGPW